MAATSADRAMRFLARTWRARRGAFGLGGAGLLAALVWSGGEARAAIEAFVINGPAPDGNGQFLSVRSPALNDEGELVFDATLTGTAGGSSSADRRGLFRRFTGGTITQVVRGGQSAPGGGTFTNYFGEAPLLNNEGDVAFITQSGTTGIYRGTPLAAIARAGQAPPDGNGVFNSVRLGGINDAGQVSFYGFMTSTTPTTANRGIFRGDGGSIVTIARAGSPAPGGVGTYTDVELYTKINEASEVAFSAHTNNPASPWGVFRGDGVGATATIARIGQPAPALGGGVNGIYNGFNSSPLAINDVGQVAFTAQVSGSSSGYNSGLFSGDGVDAAMILRAGLPAPNSSGGTTGSFSSWQRPVINNSGAVVVWAQLQGTPGGSSDNSGLFIGDGTTVRQVVRHGDPAPDGNGFFQLFGRNSIINDAGQSAFYASHTGAALGTIGGIYFHDPEEGLMTVVRAGQPLLGSTITSLSLAGNNLDIPINDMETSGLNELGQVAFQFRLATGAEGLAIWSPPSADFNDDGMVDGDDLAEWRDSFGAGTTHMTGDADGDGDADGGDFLTWQRQLGSASSAVSSAAVREPGGALMLVLGGMAAARRRPKFGDLLSLTRPR